MIDHGIDGSRISLRQVKALAVADRAMGTSKWRTAHFQATQLDDSSNSLSVLARAIDKNPRWIGILSSIRATAGRSTFEFQLACAARTFCLGLDRMH
jgi:hypothetical protein